MNPETWKSFDRALARMERRERRSRRRLSTAPLILAAGLGLGDLLLVWLVLRVWPALLAADPGEVLRGWPRLVWVLAGVCQARQGPILYGIVAVALVGLILCYTIRPMRILAWAAALAVVLADAGIVATTILACLQTAPIG
jgi:hypothetical protein